MLEFYSHFVIAVIVFFSTNIDDIFLLAAFFADGKIRHRAIVIGQFLGIGALVFVSCLAAWFAVALPEGWVSLLGAVPLYLGVRQLVSLWRPGPEEEDDAAVQNAEHKLEKGLHSQVLAVAGVTVANGGDNLGVYIPLFVNSAAWITLFVAVFAIMTLLWCALGYVIVNNKLLGNHIRRYGHRVLPFVLILLGLHILSGAIALLP